MSNLYKLLDLTVKPLLKLIIILAFSLAYYLPEVQHVEPSVNKLHVQQALHLSKEFKINPYDALEITQTVSTIADMQGLQPKRIYAMIHQESSFKVDAKGDKGKANCLMQVHKSSGYKLYENSVEHCLITGTNILLNFHNKFGNMQKATKGYYCGSNINKSSCNKYLQGVESKQKLYEGWI